MKFSNLELKFLEVILKSGSLKFGSFLTKSNRNSPYFIDFGHISDPDFLNIIGHVYALKILQHFPEFKGVIYGPAYKGISLAIITAYILKKNYLLDIRYVFNRKEKKKHGEKSDIIGSLKKNEDLIIVEDVITSGASFYENFEILKKYNANIIAAIIGINRNEYALNSKLKASDVIYNDLGFQVFEIMNINDIVKFLYNKKFCSKIWIDDNIKEKISKYINQYD